MIKFLFLTIPSIFFKKIRLIHIWTTKKSNKFQIGYLRSDYMDDETPSHDILRGFENETYIQA